MLLRDELRAATRAEHEWLERALALDRAGVSRNRYIAYLRGWLAFCRSTERDFIAGRKSWEFAVDCTARIAWLEDDLAFLAASRTTRPVASAGLALHALPELAGASYVVEGSMLGGQVLYRELGRRWRIERHAGGSFLWGYGPQCAQRWRAFVCVLNGLCLTHAERQRCAVAARATFHLLGHCFLAQSDRTAAGRSRRGRTRMACPADG